MIPEKKYTIPTLGALAVSMTACPTVADTAETLDGDWEAIEFNGKEISDHYSTNVDYNCKSYLDLSMTISGENVDMLWKLSYEEGRCNDNLGTISATLLGDYIIDEEGNYDILVESSGSPSRINFICTFETDAFNCSKGTIKWNPTRDGQESDPKNETELGRTYFDHMGGKIE